MITGNHYTDMLILAGGTFIAVVGLCNILAARRKPPAVVQRPQAWSGAPVDLRNLKG